jgi:transcriptional regulator with XRE-family HTH domain
MPEKLTRHNGSTLRYMRIKSGKKTKELATEVKCQYSHLDNLENERKECSLELLHRIATALDVPATALVRDPAFLMHAADRVSA